MAETINNRNGIFVGTDLKFALTIDTPGFSMDDDDFEVQILGRSRNKTIKKEEMLLTSGGTETGHEGNGFIRITKIA